MKRIIITVDVPDDTDTHDLATNYDGVLGSDITVWNWDAFWADHRDGRVGAHGDATAATQARGEEKLPLTDADGVTWEPYITPDVVGFRALRGNDVEFVYLNPSSDSNDGQPNVFLYHDTTGSPDSGASVVYVDVFAPSLRPRSGRQGR